VRDKEGLIEGESDAVCEAVNVPEEVLVEEKVAPLDDDEVLVDELVREAPREVELVGVGVIVTLRVRTGVRVEDGVILRKQI